MVLYDYYKNHPITVQATVLKVGVLNRRQKDSSPPPSSPLLPPGITPCSVMCVMRHLFGQLRSEQKTKSLKRHKEINAIVNKTKVNLSYKDM